VHLVIDLILRELEEEVELEEEASEGSRGSVVESGGGTELLAVARRVGHKKGFSRCSGNSFSFSFNGVGHLVRVVLGEMLSDVVFDNFDLTVTAAARRGQ
jgi:hypothetical protein